MKASGKACSFSSCLQTFLCLNNFFVVVVSEADTVAADVVCVILKKLVISGGCLLSTSLPSYEQIRVEFELRLLHKLVYRVKYDFLPQWPVAV